MIRAIVSPSLFAQGRLYYATGCTSKLTKLPSYRKARGQRRWSERSESWSVSHYCPAGWIYKLELYEHSRRPCSRGSLSLARSSLSEQKPVHIKSFSLTSARAKSLRSAPSVVSGGTPGQGENERESARSRRQGQLWNDERMCTNTVSILICLFVAAPHSLSVSAARTQYKKQPSHLPAFEAAAVWVSRSLCNLYALFASVAASTNKYKKLFQLLVWRHVSRKCACSFTAFLLERMTN
jgi:hypothetical protein